MLSKAIPQSELPKNLIFDDSALGSALQRDSIVLRRICIDMGVRGTENGPSTRCFAGNGYRSTGNGAGTLRTETVPGGTTSQRSVFRSTAPIIDSQHRIPAKFAIPQCTLKDNFILAILHCGIISQSTLRKMPIVIASNRLVATVSE